MSYAIITLTAFLNPNLKDNATNTTSASTVVQTYVSMILQQADIKLDALPDLLGHQKIARDHGEYWNKTILRAMSTAIADIIDYANQFQSFL